MMPIGMSRSVSGEAGSARRRRARGLRGQRRRDALDDRADDPQQGPDRGDADGAGADEAHLFAEGRPDQRLEVGGGTAGRCSPVCHGTSTNQLMMQADQHGDADRHADQMANARSGPSTGWW